jgi:hypothetical protein
MASDRLRVARNGQELEEIALEHLDAKLSTGELLPSDWGLKDGDSAWTQLYIIAGQRLIEFSALDTFAMSNAIGNEFSSTEELIRQISGELDELSDRTKKLREQKKTAREYLSYVKNLRSKSISREREIQREEEWAEREREKAEERAEEEAEEQGEIATSAGYIKEDFDKAKRMGFYEFRFADHGIDPDTDGTMSDKAIEKAYQKIWLAMRAVEPTEEEFLDMGRTSHLGQDGHYEIITAYLKKKALREQKQSQD